MKRPTLFIVAALALLVPGTAAAKGPSAATITGPGLSSPIAIAGVGEGDRSTDLGLLVMDGGWFQQVFGSTGLRLRSAPRSLGARYVVTYTVPGGSTTSRLEQSLYPYAAGGPVTHMRPGQLFWDTQRTTGGWIRGSAQLKQMLLSAGLPETPPAGERSNGRTIGVAAGAGIALVAAVLALRRRR
ncbi:MAG TPA: hypothetical protein VNR59_09750 [Gaiellaceae bacterium]|jgi:hypothetical protein|nr:hypothetical protein [Gaiellaceae bacterium]HWJ44953.1 hypothetical protein [Gaiellaceae bacterium]